MAEFKSFGIGFETARDNRATLAETRRKNTLDAEDKLRDDLRAQAEQTAGFLKDSLDQVRTMNADINAAKLEAAKAGQLTPEAAAEFARSQAAVLAQGGVLLEEVRQGMLKAGADPTEVQALGGGIEFVTQQQELNRAQTRAAFANAPAAKGRAEAIQKITAFETAMSSVDGPYKATEQDIKALFNTNSDPRIVNFINREGDRKSVDVTAADGRERVAALVAQNYWAFSGQLPANGLAGLFINEGDFADYAQFQKDTIKLLAETDRLRVQAKESSDVYTGFVGATLSGLNTMVTQARQFGRFVNPEDGDLEADMMDSSGNVSFENLNFEGIFEKMEAQGVDSKLIDAARASRAFRFNLSSLAFMLARLADPNDRLSAQEVQFQLDNLGDGNLSTLGAILDEVERRAAVALDAEIRVRSSMDPRFSETALEPGLQKFLDDYRAGAAGIDGKEKIVKDLVTSAPASGKLPMEWWATYNSLPPELQKKVKADLRASRSNQQ